MILIGSRALEVKGILPRWRKCADWDFVSDPVEFMIFLNICHNNHEKVHFSESKKYPGKFLVVLDDKHRLEFDCTMNESRKYMIDHEILFSANSNIDEPFHQNITELPFANNYKVSVANSLVLWCMKRSHAGIVLHSNKTIADLIFITKEILGTFDWEMIVKDFLHPEEIVLLELLTKEANERNKVHEKEKKINFNKDKDLFFKSSRKLRIYPHDDVHDITSKYVTGPLYRDNLKYEDKALIDNNKFFSRSLDYRLTMIQEEIAVLSIERFYLNDRSLSQQRIYQMMMIQFITTMCKGKTQDFILDHIHLLTKPTWNYLQYFIDNEYKLEEIKE